MSIFITHTLKVGLHSIFQKVTFPPRLHPVKIWLHTVSGYWRKHEHEHSKTTSSFLLETSLLWEASISRILMRDQLYPLTTIKLVESVGSAICYLTTALRQRRPLGDHRWMLRWRQESRAFTTAGLYRPSLVSLIANSHVECQAAWPI